MASLWPAQIVCTLGPKSAELSIMEDLLRAGMSVARFNFSHGSHEYHQGTLNTLRQAMLNTRLMCAVLLDTKGPEIRTGMLKGGKPVLMEAGREVTIHTDYTLHGDEHNIAMSYKKLPNDVAPGAEVSQSSRLKYPVLLTKISRSVPTLTDPPLPRNTRQILIGDGSIVMVVLSCHPENGTVRCRCANTAMLGERKNVNLPGVVVDLPTITEKDRDDILGWGVPNGIDFIAASFVRKGSDVRYIREVLGEEGKSIKIISKVENQEGLVNFDDILEESDGVMVARGDLGMEIPTEKIFLAQKLMIEKCNAAGKPVVTATQMLESMVKNPRPTRAEATDVANAVLDGTDCVMLSGETAAGAYPREAVEIMAGICEEAEQCVDNWALSQALLNSTMSEYGIQGAPLSTIEALASSTVMTAAKVKAACIVVLAANGDAARMIAKYRPAVPIVVGVVPRRARQAIGFNERELRGQQVARQLMVTRGLIPVVVSGEPIKELDALNSMDDDAMESRAPTAAKRCVMAAVRHARQQMLCRPGDKVVAMYNVEKRCAVVRVIEIVDEKKDEDACGVECQLEDFIPPPGDDIEVA